MNHGRPAETAESDQAVEEYLVTDAIVIDPPILRAEIAPKLTDGKGFDAYHELARSNDPRDEGVVVRIGNLGLHALDDEFGYIIGLPNHEVYTDEGIEGTLGQIIDDFRTAPDGTDRTFSEALYIEGPTGVSRLAIINGIPVRVTLPPSRAFAPAEVDMRSVLGFAALKIIIALT